MYKGTMSTDLESLRKPQGESTSTNEENAVPRTDIQDHAIMLVYLFLIDEISILQKNDPSETFEHIIALAVYPHIRTVIFHTIIKTLLSERSPQHNSEIHVRAAKLLYVLDPNFSSIQDTIEQYQELLRKNSQNLEESKKIQKLQAMSIDLTFAQLHTDTPIEADEYAYKTQYAAHIFTTLDASTQHKYYEMILQLCISAAKRNTTNTAYGKIPWDTMLAYINQLPVEKSAYRTIQQFLFYVPKEKLKTYQNCLGAYIISPTEEKQMMQFNTSAPLELDNLLNATDFIDQFCGEKPGLEVTQHMIAYTQLFQWKLLSGEHHLNTTQTHPSQQTERTAHQRNMELMYTMAYEQWKNLPPKARKSALTPSILLQYFRTQKAFRTIRNTRSGEHIQEEYDVYENLFEKYIAPMIAESSEENLDETLSKALNSHLQQDSVTLGDILRVLYAKKEYLTKLRRGENCPRWVDIARRRDISGSNMQDIIRIIFTQDTLSFYKAIIKYKLTQYKVTGEETYTLALEQHRHDILNDLQNILENLSEKMPYEDKNYVDYLHFVARKIIEVYPIATQYSKEYFPLFEKFLDYLLGEYRSYRGRASATLQVFMKSEKPKLPINLQLKLNSLFPAIESQQLETDTLEHIEDPEQLLKLLEDGSVHLKDVAIKKILSTISTDDLTTNIPLGKRIYAVIQHWYEEIEQKIKEDSTYILSPIENEITALLDRRTLSDFYKRNGGKLPSRPTSTHPHTNSVE